MIIQISGMLTETEDQRRTMTKMQRMECQTIVDKNNCALKRDLVIFTMMMMMMMYCESCVSVINTRRYLSISIPIYKFIMKSPRSYYFR